MEGPEVHAHHHGHSGHRWFDISASICAMVVSVASLYLAIHHGNVMQEMAEANARMVTATSWPRVSLATSNLGANGAPIVDFFLTNKGIGPARIEGMEVSLDGKPVANAAELLQTCCASPDKAAAPFGGVVSTANGEILRPGEEKHYLRLNKLADDPRWAKVAELPGKVSVKVCYCSVFDECWVAQSGDMRKVEQVKACPANWSQYNG
jgi:hypothetical protein